LWRNKFKKRKTEMNLEELVPPMELCKKIPAGEFEHSALVIFKWENVKEPCIYERLSVAQRHLDNGRKKGYCFPAPTLQEIMEVLPPYGKDEKILACCVPDWANFDARIFGEHWRVGYTGDCSINDKNPATAALKLWLKLKGLENE
jgi:hypothetical protein